MKANKVIIPKKTREQITLEMENVFNGKDKSQRGTMLRSAIKVLMLTKPKEEIKKEFIEEYIKKYGELQTGKISLDKLRKDSEKDLKALKQLGTKA